MRISDWSSDVCSSDLLVFHLMAPWTIRLLIGVIARGFTANYWVRRIARNGTPERRPGPASGWLWGAVSGFTSFTAHAGGPPVNVYLLPLALPKTQYQATTVAFFLLVNYVKDRKSVVSGKGV